jgi:hypothetical protein
MKLPKTVKGYLKLLIAIADDRSDTLKNATEEERRIIGYMRGDIQNGLGEDEAISILDKHGLKWEG